MNKNAQLQKGFTLVELLVVIGVLGVLAAAVLTAINPAEQLARGRDAGRKSTISQLGNANQAYFTSLSNYSPTTTPTPGSGWISHLVNSGDIKTVPSQVVGASTPCPSAGGVVAHNGWCYAVSSGESVIFTAAESIAEKAKYTPTCGSVVWITWSSVAGKTGLACAATSGPVPTTPIQ